MAHVQSINFNPTWTVPVSLIKKDIIPHVRKDAGYLARMKIRILDGHGRELDPATIDWATEKAADYTLRQDAGTANSLGQIRIDMPTARRLHARHADEEALRPRRPLPFLRLRAGRQCRKELAAWLLEGTPGPGAAAAWSPPESTPRSPAPSARMWR